MQRRTALKFPFAAAALVFATPALADSPASQEQSIRAQVDQFVSAWNSHDMKKLAQLFAGDAQFVNVVGMWWKNRAEIEAAHVATHQTMFKESKLTAKVESLKKLRPDVYVAHAPWTLEGARTPDGQPVPTRTGILVFVFTRENGRWLVQTAQNTDIVPAALAPPVLTKGAAR